MILRLLAILLLPLMAVADYVPSGPYRYYNADADSSRVATGGPLRNYYDNGTWRAVNPNFSLVGGKLVSPFGRHKVQADLATNIVRLDWWDYILKLEVGALFAYQRSVATRWKLADPNFSNRSYIDNVITITDIYPDVDLRIINTPDGLKHSFTFHQAARDAFETWWQNNGKHEDIYIVNAIRLGVDSLGLSWVDSAGTFDLSTNRDITGAVRLKLGGATKFFLRPNRIMHDTADGWATVYKRVIIMAGDPYLVEGFKWTTIRDWPEGDIYHDAEFGGKGSTGSVVATTDGWKVACIYTSGGTAGTTDSIYITAKDNGTDDSVFCFYYGDSADYGGSDTVPAALIDTGDNYIEVVTNTYATYGVAMSGGTIGASTNYWIGIADKTGGVVRVEAEAIATFDQVESTDAVPITDPWGTIGDDNQYKMAVWIIYTVAGDGPTPQVIIVQ
jgi:hypothetical protein